MKNMLTNAPDTVFWVIWGIELVYMLWWTLDDLKLRYIAMNPSIYFGWLWLLLALGLFLANARVPALILVGIAGLPLAFMALFILVIAIASLFGPIRWN